MRISFWNKSPYSNTSNVVLQIWLSKLRLFADTARAALCTWWFPYSWITIIMF
jgi:hypothetical protein